MYSFFTKDYIIANLLLYAYVSVHISIKTIFIVRDQ